MTFYNEGQTDGHKIGLIWTDSGSINLGESVDNGGEMRNKR